MEKSVWTVTQKGFDQSQTEFLGSKFTMATAISAIAGRRRNTESSN